MALTKVKINLGTQGNLSGSRSIIQSTKTLVSSSAQMHEEISGSFTAASSSFSTRVTTMEGSGTAQGVGTSDSPTFNNITATGTVTAQEFHSEFVSASVTFTSGSHKFGNSTDDVHNMTGSLNVSGTINLNDGNLSVTDKMIIGSGSGFDFSGTNHSFTVKTTGNNSGFSILASGGGELVRFIQESNDAGQMDFYDGGSPKIRLSSHANANNYINNGGKVGIGTNSPQNESSGVLLHIADTGGSNAAHINLSGGDGADGSQTGKISFSDPGDPDDAVAFISSNIAGSNANPGGTLHFFTAADGGSMTEKLRIGSDGVSTFNAGVVLDSSSDTLSRYDEGEATIYIYTNNGNKDNAAWTNRSGYTKMSYVRVGDMVTCQGKFELQGQNNASTSNSDAVLFELPFTVYDGTDKAGECAGTIAVNRFAHGLTTSTMNGWYMLAVEGSTVAYIVSPSTQSETEQYLGGASDGNWEGQFSITYRTQ